MPAASRTCSSDAPSRSVSLLAASAEQVPESKRLPKHPMPKRVGSSDLECDALAFQDRPLLNVQFHECLVIASRQLHCCEFACNASRESNLLERCSIAVSQLAGRVGRAGSGKQAASQASDAKARWFFRSEHEQFNRMFRTKPRLP